MKLERSPKQWCMYVPLDGKIRKVLECGQRSWPSDLAMQNKSPQSLPDFGIE